MGLGDANGDLAARYGCTQDQLLEENELLLEIVIELLEAIELHDPLHISELYGISANKLQILLSFLRRRRLVQ